MSNDTSSTPKTVPVNELYKLIWRWRAGNPYWQLAIVDALSVLGYSIPEGLEGAICNREDPSEILKNHGIEL